ncbi:hypothetical protein RV00_GL001376 [Enterococcus devriesei]|uniref:Uncharacterized protein n=1 Tax=Enterococcus devriesei TaxID=319970 RepID=A0A1L8SY02_9ENTE|nr:hypothetical protein RV00_GL001376 [Enterococcus devriesei]
MEGIACFLFVLGLKFLLQFYYRNKEKPFDHLTDDQLNNAAHG